jgi:cell fate regulator YaaT (PSP1 superfamily)
MPKYVVRYGAMRSLGVFTARGSDQFKRGSEVIARTNRGLEAGEVLCEATPQAVEQIKNQDNGQILRRMTTEDLNERAHMELQARDEFEVCQRYVEKLKLEMELVDIEHVFGGERIVVFYLADERVDFRELVRQLAGEFQTRIEMRQIGVRDEARLLADYGDCGKPVCCNTHLSAMPPVSMKMAKIQKATLDPTKISGRCGRLKCCLRYEYDAYVEMQNELPPIGSDIITQNGRGQVLNQSILAGQLLMQMEDGRRVLIGADSVVTVLKRGRGLPARKKDVEMQTASEENNDDRAETSDNKRRDA